MTTAPAAVTAVPVYRVAPHPGPESEVTVTARCMDGGCGWESEPVPRPETGAADCAAHTAATGHAVFAVLVEYVALVTATFGGEEGSG
ncbi:hypothetical protein AB0E83_09120 [Streptomyces sp. NPDC035033]|uniref:DUF7848 domain-containing protein n=1 Tax=Streptomyces sp. NPDC035033 TaxID=3155368 RepID=UPI0033D7040A